MKVSPNGGHGKSMSIASAVNHKLTPSAYSYDGKLEQLESKINLQSEMIAELIERLAIVHLLLKKEDLEAILGYSYEIIEDRS